MPNVRTELIASVKDGYIDKLISSKRDIELGNAVLKEGGAYSFSQFINAVLGDASVMTIEEAKAIDNIFQKN